MKQKKPASKTTMKYCANTFFLYFLRTAPCNHMPEKDSDPIDCYLPPQRKTCRFINQNYTLLKRDLKKIKAMHLSL